LIGVFLEVALPDFGVLVGQNLGHLFLGEAEAEDFQGVLGGLAVGEFFLAVGHLEEVHVVGVGEAAHIVLVLFCNEFHEFHELFLEKSDLFQSDLPNRVTQNPRKSIKSASFALLFLGVRFGKSRYEESASICLICVIRVAILPTL
jgi:hypothetical protein